MPIILEYASVPHPEMFVPQESTPPLTGNHPKLFVPQEVTPSTSTANHPELFVPQEVTPSTSTDDRPTSRNKGKSPAKKIPKVALWSMQERR